jgi:hypothetical protein
VTLLPDDVPEDTEVVRFILVSVTLEVDSGPTEGLSPRLGAISEAVVQIAENDDARGVFALQRRSASVAEGDVLPLRVVRSRGLFHRVAVELELTVPAPPACEDVSRCTMASDFNATRVTLVFEEGETEHAVPIAVIDDDEAELAESFIVEILTAEGARIDASGSIAELEVEANDDPHGIFYFAPEDVEAAASAEPIFEPQVGSTRAAWTVVRRQGLFGSVVVSWTLERTDVASVHQVDPLRDVVARSGSVTFAEGQDEAQLAVFIVADDVGELQESFRVRLTEIVEGGGRLSDRPEEALSIDGAIAANDDPFGVFRIAQAGSTVDIVEGDVTPGEATITVVRERSALGTVDVLVDIMTPSLSDLARRQLGYSLDSLDDLILLRIFDGPVEGALLNVPVDVIRDVESALECMSLCFADPAQVCESVSVWPGEECLLHAGTRGSPSAYFLSRYAPEVLHFLLRCSP